MKILHILDHSIPYINGYTSRSKYIIEFQKKIGFDPSAISSPRQPIQYNQEGEIDGIVYHRCENRLSWVGGVLDKIPVLSQYYSMKYFQKRIDKVVRENSINIIHAHSPILCGMPGLWVARKYGIPLVYEVRALWEDAAVDQEKTKEGAIRYRLTKYFETEMLRRADLIIVICEGLKNEIISRGIRSDKIYVIPNGVDTDKFVPRNKDLDLLNKLGLHNQLIVGFIGSFFKFEGLEILVKAVPRILAKIKNVKFLIVGSGREDAKLKQLCGMLKLEKDIIFTGQVAHSDSLRYYSIMDVLIYPRLSKRITNLVTPLKPLEAMSMEKAVMASDVGGLKELIVSEKTGLLFKAEDVDDLAVKCVRLLENATMREELGRQARLNVMQNRNWLKIISEYKEIYKTIAKNS